MITDADPALVAQLAEVLELRAADPQQGAMRQAYLGDIRFPPGPGCWRPREARYIPTIVDRAPPPWSPRAGFGAEAATARRAEARRRSADTVRYQVVRQS